MIETSNSTISYVGNGSTVTAYPIPFLFFENEHIYATAKDASGAETIFALGTDFTLTGAGNPSGGSLVTIAALPATSTLTIFRNVPYTQETAYEEGDAFPAKSHERAQDLDVMRDQQLARGMSEGEGGLGTAFRLTEASGGIKALSKVLDSVVGIDANGDAILRTPSNALSWLGQVGATWANSAERANTRGAFAGQTGVQRDNWTIYVARSTAPGDWVPHLQGSGVVISTNGTPSAKNNPAGDIVGTTEVQSLANKTLNNPHITNPTGMVPADVGLGNVDNTSDETAPVSIPQQEALNQKQDLNVKGLTNGYASLDGSAKVPLEQLPSEFLGARSYQGTWNATTGLPTIPAASAGNTGNYYVVSVAGTSTPPGGPSSWAIGDSVISNGTIWQKVPAPASGVTSVNSKVGVVNLVKGDIALGNVDNTSDAQKNAMEVTLTNKTIRGSEQNLMQVRLDADVVNNLPVARLANGTGAAGNTWWCGDGTWKQPAGTGDVTGGLVSVDGQLPVFDGVDGKHIKAYAGPAGILMTSGNVVSSDVHALTEKVEVVDNDEVVIWDSVTGTLMRVKKKNLGIPVGVIMDFAGPEASAPVGWLLCFGQLVSRTTYASLFGVLGTIYGAGDGSTTFKIPDLRGIVCAGKDNMGGTAANVLTSTTVAPNGNTVGARGGAQTQTLVIAHLPIHSHNYGSHFHTTRFQALVGAAGIQAGPHYNMAYITEGSSGPNINPDFVGSNAAHGNIQPTQVVVKIIKY